MNSTRSMYICCAIKSLSDFDLCCGMLGLHWQERVPVGSSLPRRSQCKALRSPPAIQTGGDQLIDTGTFLDTSSFSINPPQSPTHWERLYPATLRARKTRPLVEPPSPVRATGSCSPACTRAFDSDLSGPGSGSLLPLHDISGVRFTCTGTSMLLVSATGSAFRSTGIA